MKDKLFQINKNKTFFMLPKAKAYHALLDHNNCVEYYTNQI